jgi:3-dehydroquinate synthase
MEEIHIKTAGGDYRVVIGRLLYKPELEEIFSLKGFGKAAIVSHPSLLELHGKPLLDALDSIYEKGQEVACFTFPEGEEYKNLQTLEEGYAFLLDREFSREDIIFAFGGGVAGDLTGYLASSYMRGVDYIQLPTTLMSMVDSSIGGKVGVDLPGAKNAIGSFYQPIAVISDLEVLSTLPDREFKAGMAEVAKYGFLYDASLLREIQDWNGDSQQIYGSLESIITRCVEIKGGIVERDDRDITGERAMLNYGHTFGHALESSTGYQLLKHGEAVAIGMIMAARASELAGIAENGIAEMHMRILRPIVDAQHLRGHLDIAKAFADMSKDKKRGKDVRFVLLEGPQKPILVNSLPEWVVKKAMEETIEIIGEVETCL